MCGNSHLWNMGLYWTFCNKFHLVSFSNDVAPFLGAISCPSTISCRISPFFWGGGELKDFGGSSLGPLGVKNKVSTKFGGGVTDVGGGESPPPQKKKTGLQETLPSLPHPPVCDRQTSISIHRDTCWARPYTQVLVSLLARFKPPMASSMVYI